MYEAWTHGVLSGQSVVGWPIVNSARAMVWYLFASDKLTCTYIFLCSLKLCRSGRSLNAYCWPTSGRYWATAEITAVDKGAAIRAPNYIFYLCNGLDVGMGSSNQPYVLQLDPTAIQLGLAAGISRHPSSGLGSLAKSLRRFGLLHMDVEKHNITDADTVVKMVRGGPVYNAWRETT